MKFSVILPCYLGFYQQAGKDRELKLLRAIESVLRQNADFELIVIADGCEQTINLVKANYTPKEVRLIDLPKQKPFSGVVRNTGIDYAKGDWICYLDSDDVFGGDHLSILEGQINGHDWIFFNDLIWTGKEFQERTCQIKPYMCGTSNVAHKKVMLSRWDKRNDYGKDDWNFITKLQKESTNWKKTDCASYCVCHIPGKAGYDI